ncbi:putative nucleotidyltransferase substrate binding domain-containing protein [Coralloluteibacterium thermophilus]|uniref:Nucleotidyltransferase substrate binding domain-containing protein n=1 Tax=Coralloluteibacterium thermophilum TaxID=2707049 RepID=A0ABV9NNI0_9GAMM
MHATSEDTLAFLRAVPPFDRLPPPELEALAQRCERSVHEAGSTIYSAGAPIAHLYVLECGEVEIRDADGGLVSELGAGDCFGERGLLRDGVAATTARTRTPAVLLQVPADAFARLMARHPAVAGHFARSGARLTRSTGLATVRARDLMLRVPVTCPPDLPADDVARLMRTHDISCVVVVDPARQPVGIVTGGDLARRVLADRRDPATPAHEVMTPDPRALPPSALGSDILRTMLEARIGHLPVVEDGRLVGVITQTDLTRYQALLAAGLVAQVNACRDSAAMAAVTARVPALLMQLVEAGTPHTTVTRLVTDVADAATRRLIALAEAALGPAPVPYVWLACGSQGRQEQTGITDQDNCLFVDDSAGEADMAYFERFARSVCDGLHEAGYVHCPGGMMAMNPRWCRPVRTWRRYFSDWIATPNPEAQMLASVMFDLRPIAGTAALFEGVQAETLAIAAARPMFVAHMIANALRHAPPLGILRGLSTIRSGAHRKRVDMKHGGVVPVVDLARLYALQARIPAVNTRARLEAAGAAGTISASGARDLVEAYDLIATLRLEHQARLVRAGRPPDNYLAPADLSDFERGHLRDAFVVVRGMQSAIGHGRNAFT